jgi:hypothetical protein
MNNILQLGKNKSTRINALLTMGRTPRQHTLTGCRRRLPLHQASSHSRSIHLSHAKVGFCDLLQSLLAVTCHSSGSVLQAILPIFALSLSFTDGNTNGGGGTTTTQMGTAVMVTTTKDESLRLCFVLYWGGTPSKSVGFGGSSVSIIYTTIFL